MLATAFFTPYYSFSLESHDPYILLHNLSIATTVAIDYIDRPWGSENAEIKYLPFAEHNSKIGAFCYLR